MSGISAPAGWQHGLFLATGQSTSVGTKGGRGRCSSCRRMVRSWALLEKSDVLRGAWFVALHVLDIRWRGTTAGLQAILNADTASYLSAIDEITRGGFVVRMGDAEAPPLPPLANGIARNPDQRHTLHFVAFSRG